MKINFHYHFYSRIFISLLIFSFGFFLLQKSVDTRAIIGNVYTNNTPIVGWAWNDKMGWIALNCANDFDGDGVPNGGYNADGSSWGSCSVDLGAGFTSWGLKMTVDPNNSDLRYIKGCAWAGNVADAGTAGAAPGWICFSDTEPSTTNAPTKGVAMSQSVSNETSCSCQPITGTCEGPVANNLCINDGANKYCSLDRNDVCVQDSDLSLHCSVDRYDACININNGVGNCRLDPGVSCSDNSQCISSCSVVGENCRLECSSNSDCFVFTTNQCNSYTSCSGLEAWPTTSCISANICRELAPGVKVCSETGDNCVTNANCSLVQKCSGSNSLCSTNADCPTWRNDCVNNVCYTSKTSCTIDSDCEFACVNNSSSFLARGVCFDYANYTQAQKDILLNLRGQLPPFNTGDSYMHSCYINKDCYNTTDHIRGECVYPQYGLAGTLIEGTGRCMDDSTTPATPQVDGATCVYDFDCILGNYCALTLDSVLPNAPTSCTSLMCTGGYEKITTTITVDSYANALNSNPLHSEGFASIVKMESVTTTSGYAQANRLGFPIQSRVEDSGFPATDPNYDIDNPNNITSWPSTTFTDNPIRGCFNCYREKIYKCVSGISCECANQNDDTCIAERDNCEEGDDSNNSCRLYSLSPAVCENCQEYFYATKNESTCSIRTDKDCSSTACPDGFGSCVARKEGDLKKVLTGFNCTECTVDNFNNSCALNASNINSNSCKKCQTRSGNNFTSNIYRIGGVLYDNQHGRTSNGVAATSTLCGWGYNAWNDVASADKGFGWFNFSPNISTSTKPYFSVEKGNIYSKGRISTLYQPPINKYNASYLIETSGDIRNFVSGASKSSSTPAFQGELPNRKIIDFLALAAGKYTNALGKLDYQGLVTVVKDGKNKYGSAITTIYKSDLAPRADDIFLGAFNNQVFYVTGNSPSNPGGTTYVTLDEGHDLEVLRGSNSNESGAGIIIIDGNLKITRNITYGPTTGITNLRQIPSLVWIVKGDVEVESDVTELAGTFIVLGDGANNCSAIDPDSNNNTDLPQPRLIPRSFQGCGQFLSVHFNTSTWQYSNLSSASFLKVYGNVLARKFVLVRMAVDKNAGTPAEQFINDGRLQSNPPLGLSDMSRVIPRFSSY